MRGSTATLQRQIIGKRELVGKINVFTANRKEEKKIQRQLW